MISNPDLSISSLETAGGLTWPRRSASSKFPTRSSKIKRLVLVQNLKLKWRMEGWKGRSTIKLRMNQGC